MEDDLLQLEELAHKWGLAQQGEKPTITILGGGISNLVVKIETKRGTWVVKQALKQLRVQDEWFADRSRIFKETSCLNVIRDVVGKEYAPEVIAEDREQYACALEYALNRTWKQDLLSDIADRRITYEVSKILAKFHLETAHDRVIQEKFDDVSNFVELRIDPYFKTLETRHPDMKDKIEEIIRSLLQERICLVHGDFSPKNILLLSDGRIWIVDCEVAHWGNPAFDIAFCTNHLLLKAIHLKSPDHLEQAEILWTEYWKLAKSLKQEENATRTLAVLMLARVDGKSPAEYLTIPDKEMVRALSTKLIYDRIDDFQVVSASVSNHLR